MRSAALAATLGLLLTACAGDAPAPAPAEKPVEKVAEKPADPPKPPAVPDVEKPPEGAKVLFLAPADRAEVKSPVKVKMGVEGMKVQPAGELATATGHHHIIINEGHIALGDVVPKDATHIHFGKGDTETELELTPGDYTLTLQFADGTHRSYGEQLSTSIQIKVTE